MHLLTKMFKHIFYYYFFGHVLSCQMNQWYKQVHDGPGWVCRKGWCACVEVSENKGGLNEKTKVKAILSLWMSVTTDCMFTSALSLCFTMQATLNTSSPRASSRTLALPLVNEPLSGPFFQLSFVNTARHYRFGQSKQDRETRPDATCHFSIYRPTSAHEHTHTHTLLFFTITLHTHTHTHCTYCTLWRTQGAINYWNGQF